MSHIRVVGVPMDLGARTRGTDMGPSALRLTGLLGRLRALGHAVEDGGNFAAPIPELSDVGDTRLRFGEPIAAVCRRLADAVASAVREEQVPLVLGGDHSLSLGSVGGAARVHRERGRPLGLIWVDAHGDINTPETTPSGSVHGMPLAALLGHGPDLLTDVPGLSPAVHYEHAVLIASRDLDPGERDLIRQHGIRAFTMSEVDRRGIAAVAGEALAIAGRGTAGVYVSLDMDAVDPEVAPGVGTPVRGGLTYRESHLLMEVIAESGRLAGVDVTEVNPSLDDRNATAELAAELVLSIFGKRIL
ncbi:MAG: arginase [Dehalococcoidia bacterium]|nr:arginase [Dehalococcoidia bacterium]